MVEHDELIQAGAPALDDGLKYTVGTYFAGTVSPQSMVTVEIERQGLSFWKRLLGGARVVHVNAPLTEVVDPTADDLDEALIRNLVNLCKEAHDKYRTHTAQSEAVRRIHG